MGSTGDREGSTVKSKGGQAREACLNIVYPLISQADAALTAKMPCGLLKPAGNKGYEMFSRTNSCGPCCLGDITDFILCFADISGFLFFAFPSFDKNSKKANN